MTESLSETTPPETRDYSVDAGQDLPSMSWEVGYIPTDEEVIEEVFSRLGYAEFLESPASMNGKALLKDGKTVPLKDFHDFYPNEDAVLKSRKILRGLIMLDRNHPAYARTMQSTDARVRALLPTNQTPGE